MTRSTVPLFAFEANEAGAAFSSDLVKAAETTIAALREQNVIQPWHELDCAIALEAARGASLARGVAKAHMLTALLAARAKLPEPMTSADVDDEFGILLDERAAEWAARHLTELPNEEVAG